MFLRNLISGFRVRAAAKMASIRSTATQVHVQCAKTVVPGFLATSVAGLLFLSIHKDPLVPRYHITLSNILDKTWAAGNFESTREKIIRDGLSPTHPLSIRYMDLGRKVTSGYDKIHWEFCVLDNENEFRTFSLMIHNKGFIYSTSKAVREFQTDGQIAAILAHEASHVLSRHISEDAATKILPMVCIPMLYGLSGLVLPGYATIVISVVIGIAGYVSAKFYNRSKSPRRESQADQMGALLLASIGFDPLEMVNAITTLHLFIGDPVGFLPTHPPFKKRVQSLLLSSAYEEARKKYLENGN